MLGVLVFLLLTLVLSAALLCHSIQLDVHIEVNEESFFSNLSSQLAALLPNNEIDFRTTSLPHVTLYLTDFEDNLLPSVINGYVHLLTNNEVGMNQPNPYSDLGKFAIFEMTVARAG